MKQARKTKIINKNQRLEIPPKQTTVVVENKSDIIY